jgi:hypothetical protein
MRSRRLWPADGRGCKSCRTIRRFPKLRGYCTRCYPIIYRISRIDRGLYRFHGRWAHLKTSTAGIRKSAETELEQIRVLEAPIRDGAIGTDIENLLVAIAEHARAKPEAFQGVRHFFDGCLDVEQRRRIYEVLARLAENLPGRQSIQSSFVRKQRQAWENAEWKTKLRALDEGLQAQR